MSAPDGERPSASSQSLPDSESTSCQGERGRIIEVKLTDFLCHDKLEVTFGDKINILIGQNGCGKTDIYTAVLVGVDGKMADTNNEIALNSLIRNGQYCAVIDIALENLTEIENELYKADHYGDEIQIIRTITNKPSSYKLISSTGRLVSTKKEDMQQILNRLNIQIDSPFLVLNRSTEKTDGFVFTSPKKVYCSFVEDGLIKSIRRMQTSLLKDLIPGMKGSFAKWKHYMESIKDSANTTNMQFDTSNLEHVIQCEEQLVSLEKVLDWSTCDKILAIDSMKIDVTDLCIYSDWMVDLVAAINLAHKENKFDRKPRGPIGAYIRLKEKSWGPAIEELLGLTLKSFCVHSDRDNSMLDSLIQGLNIQDTPPIIVTKFIYEVHNTTEFEVIYPGGASLLRSITVIDPVVANVLIDLCEIEQVLLLHSNENPYVLMRNELNVPSNCSKMLTIDGTIFSPMPNYRVYSPDLPKEGKLRLLCNKEPISEYHLVVNQLEAVSNAISELQSSIIQSGDEEPAARVAILNINEHLERASEFQDGVDKCELQKLKSTCDELRMLYTIFSKLSSIDAEISFSLIADKIVQHMRKSPYFHKKLIVDKIDPTVLGTSTSYALLEKDRCFSIVTSLLGLWNNISQPVFGSDASNVCLDPLNKAWFYKLIVDRALNISNKQFIMLSTQDVESMISPSENVKIIRMGNQ